MNRLGEAASSYYQDYLPSQYASIPDPGEHFRLLGERLEAQVSDLAVTMAGPDLPGESYLAKVGRLNAARLQAQEQVLADQVYGLTPEHSQMDHSDLGPQLSAELTAVNAMMRELNQD